MQKQLWVIFGLVFAVLIAPAAAQGYMPEFFETDCLFGDLNRVTCGVLVVPEDRANPDGNQVELAVAIVAPANGDFSQVPVIYLEGGPGGSAVLAADEFIDHNIADTRELILIDQRGTGFSFPSLNCFELEEDDENGTENCYNRLVSEGINLSAYNSLESAADIEDLRVTLGYDIVNIWGISYGTRLGLTVLRQYPDSVNAAVLDSVFPPEINSLEDTAFDTADAFDIFLGACASDATCSANYPDLATTFETLILDLNETPAVFQYDDGEEIFEFELFGDDVLGAMFQTLYNSSAIPMLPYGIELLATAQDDFDYTDGWDIIQGFYTPNTWLGFEEEIESSANLIVAESDAVLDYFDEFGDISDSEGMYTSVNCAEEVNLEDIDTAYNNADTASDVIYNFVLNNIDGLVFDCDVWQVETAPASEATRVQSDIPTLLISGGLDPVTPVAYGDSALEGLSNGVHVVFPFGGHSETGARGCGGAITAAFFDNPTTTPDTACIPQDPGFYVE
ncbi:MAG: alpha/beta fold hydrolase [Chloroflexota bacterium]